MAVFERTTSGLWTPMTPNTCNIQDANSVDLNSKRHGQFQEKEKTPAFELDISLSKKSFDEKNKKTRIKIHWNKHGSVRYRVWVHSQQSTSKAWLKSVNFPFVKHKQKDCTLTIWVGNIEIKNDFWHLTTDEMIYRRMGQLNPVFTRTEVAKVKLLSPHVQVAKWSLFCFFFISSKEKWQKNKKIILTFGQDDNFSKAYEPVFHRSVSFTATKSQCLMY